MQEIYGEIDEDLSAAEAVFSWPYLLVPLMMTRCAGRFTPRASVEVVHSTYGGWWGHIIIVQVAY